MTCKCLSIRLFPLVSNVFLASCSHHHHNLLFGHFLFRHRMIIHCVFHYMYLCRIIVFWSVTCGVDARLSPRSKSNVVIIITMKSGWCLELLLRALLLRLVCWCMEANKDISMVELVLGASSDCWRWCECRWGWFCCYRVVPCNIAHIMFCTSVVPGIGPGPSPRTCDERLGHKYGMERSVLPTSPDTHRLHLLQL